MRDYLRCCQRLRAGWFLAFVMLALPNCGLPTGGIPCEGFDCPCDAGNSECFPTPDGPGTAFDPGTEPVSDAIMCDIPAPLAPGDDGCATQLEAGDAANVWLTQAATALVNSRQSSFALDFSQAAMAECGGLPKKISFLGASFPDGLTVCINCGQKIPSTYATPTKACIAKCQDLINFGEGPMPAEGTNDYCEANAHTSTNYDKTMCDPRFAGACTNGGNPSMAFIDPRRTPENVKWIDFDPAGMDDFGGSSSLQRVAATTGTTDADYNQGASSLQVILNGDAWVEFGTGDTGASLMNHVISLRPSCDDPVNICPDTDDSLANIGYAINLSSDGNVYVIEGTAGFTPNVLGPFGAPYAAGERFRVKAVDNHNGTATITYSRFHACTPGPGCTEDEFAASTPTPLYPLRVDTSFREQNAILLNVTLVRIIQ